MRIQVFFFLCCSFTQTLAQGTHVDSKMADKIISLTAVNDTFPLKSRLQPFIDTIGGASIIGLGEGTHGTKEFTRVRAILTEMLVEEKGYKLIFLENPYGDTYYLNKRINDPAEDISLIMKDNLLSIYQTTEFKDFLSWVRKHNLSAAVKVNIVGIDFVFIQKTTQIFRKEINTLQIPRLDQIADSIEYEAAFQDSMWQHINDRQFKYDAMATVINAIDIYKKIRQIKEYVVTNNIHLSETAEECILNCLHGIDAFYKPSYKQQVLSRDQLMSEMVLHVANINKTKALVWAHNAHIAYAPGFGDDNGGGMGGYIKKDHADYYNIGTITAMGTYSATKDRFDNRDNIFTSYKLNIPSKNSWEALLNKMTPDVFLFYTNNIPSDGFGGLEHRLIGYTEEKKRGSYTTKDIKELYDAVIFIRETSAADHHLLN
ncbi:erythromycin esterase [Chitinophaga niastensis]|uniref:Erythromycin esterase n=1 Tax=Chitinophaga niastensis TaxID=536980 RepID=A0A2P8HCF4_CHINA|nr:erythromycin esterase family protein [Chitinophaga niastensis]PSL43898.1 erythromycin esterase [Chitinophaga niastensis]